MADKGIPIAGRFRRISGEPLAGPDDIEGLSGTLDGLDTRAAALEQGQTSDRITAASWLELVGKPGAFAGQGGEVVGLLSSTHNDPASGLTVSDGGIYRWSTAPARWDRIGDNSDQVVASKVAIGVADAVQPIDGRLAAREQQIDGQRVTAATARQVRGGGIRDGIIAPIRTLIGLGKATPKRVIGRDRYGRADLVPTPGTVARVESGLSDQVVKVQDGHITRPMRLPAPTSTRDGSVGGGWRTMWRIGDKAPLRSDSRGRVDLVPSPQMMGRVVDGLDGTAVVKRDATDRVSAAGVNVASSSVSLRDGPLGTFRSLWGMGRIRKKQLIGRDKQGRINYVPTPALVSHYRDVLGINSYLDLGALRGGYDPIYVQALADGRTLALLQERSGKLFSAFQRNDLLSTTALANGAGPIRLIIFHGQSNAYTAGTAGTNPLQGKVWPHHAMSFSNRDGFDGNVALDPGTFVDLTPLNPTTAGGLSLATATAFALEQLLRDAGRPSGGTLVWSSNWGGQPISAISKGTLPYGNLMTGVARMVAVAARYGRAVEVVAHVFDHGENESDGYEAALATLMADTRADTQALTGQAAPPLTFVMQISATDSKTTTIPVPLAQLAYAKANAAVSLQPRYYTPLAADQIHGTAIGKMMVGERVASELMDRLAGVAPLRFWPTSITRAGNVVTVTLPYPAAWDEIWVKAVANRAFTYLGSDSGSISVTGVAITGTYTVGVTLSGTPTASDRRLAYARQDPSVTVDGWSSSRGQLCTATGRQSVYQRLGFAVPATINQYCAQFEEVIP
jgi:hypothetical protein